MKTKLLSMLAGLILPLSLFADTYYWAGSSADSIADAQFWRMGSVAGPVASEAPGSGASVVFPASYTATTASALPDYASLAIESGAKLTIPGGAQFKNIAISLNGELAMTGSSSVCFGYAAAGQTTTFAMRINGGKLSLPASGTIQIACPASTGKVNVQGAIAITNLTFATEANIWQIGVNNPTNAPFAVDFAGTKMNLASSTAHTFSGAAAVAFGANACLYRPRPENAQSVDTRLVVEQAASIALRDGGYVQLPVTGNGSGSRVTFNPDVATTVMTVGSGSWFSPRMQFGNGKGKAAFSNAIWEYAVPGWWVENSNKPFPFNGLSSVEIPAGTTLRIQRNYYAWGSNQQEGASPGNMAVAPVPVTGGGSIMFDNADASKNKGFKANFYFIGGANSAGGTLSCETGRGAAFYLNDGANWAGTVVCNSAFALSKIAVSSPGALTVPAVAEPARVSVGGFDLKSDFAFRVWKNGSVFTNDVVNVGALGYTLSGGVISLAGQGGLALADVAAGTEFTLGTIPAGGTLPEIANSNVQLLCREIPGDETLETLVARIVSTAYNFTSTTSTDLLDANAWACGFVPAGQDATIMGGNVKAVFSQGVFPAFKSLAVRGGAELEIAAACALPSMVLRSDGAITIAAGGDAYLTNGIAFFAGDNGEIGRLAIAQNGTLRPGAGTYFKNVAMTIEGILEGVPGAHLRLGHAEVGETAFFELCGTGGVIRTTGSQLDNVGSIFFCSPEPGGAVRVPSGAITLKNMDVNANCNEYQGSVYWGWNNPTSVPIAVVLDDTDMDFTGSQDWPRAVFGVDGDTTISFINESRLYRMQPYNPQYGAFNPSFKGKARLVFDGQAKGSAWDVYCPLVGNGDSAFAYEPADDGIVALELRNGARYHVWRQTGNGRVVMKVTATGFIQAGTANWWGRRPTPLAGWKAVELAAGATLVLRQQRSDNAQFDPAHFHGEHAYVLSSTPITGSGSVLATNVNDYDFHVLLRSGANTATGTLSATGRARFLIDDGANWAGDVIFDDHMEIVTSTKIAKFVPANAPASVSFGKLVLAADVPIRVWKEGGVLTNDVINITGAGFSGSGNLILTPKDGYEPDQRDHLLLGAIPEEALPPSLFPRTWKLHLTPRAGESETFNMEAWFCRGTVIVIR